MSLVENRSLWTIGIPVNEPCFFLEPERYIFFEPEMVINTAKQIRTEILNLVLGSFFLEYSHSDDHFAISSKELSF